MTTATDIDSTTIELYWEARGSGAPVLLIGGTPGDAGQMTAVADDLASDHLVVTYDRRGTSRSGRPAYWTQTSVAEQVDDAVAVLDRVGLDKALVFGTSNGAAVALEFALSRPDRVTTAIVHELPLLTVLEDPAPITSALGSMIGDAMQRGGPRAALEAFLRFAFGDAVVDGWQPEFRERMLANADMAFSVELPAFQAYRPDEKRLAGCRVPVSVMVGEAEPMAFFHEAAQWLATRLHTDVANAPGAHGPQFTASAALAEMIRDIAAGVDRRE